jgi:polysaccharide export outer membrane protein
MNKYLKVGLMTPCCWLLILSGLLAAGCTSTKQREALNPPSPTEFEKGKMADLDGDRFAVEDLISLSFSGAEGLIFPSHQEHIKKDGTITLPLIGPVKADGKTPGELLKEIHDRYVPHYYKRLNINFGGPSVYYVEGQVRSPGRRECRGATTLFWAIQSESLTALAATHRIELIRASGEKIEVNHLKYGSLGLQVLPGDRIVVPKRASWDVFQQ